MYLILIYFTMRISIAVAQNERVRFNHFTLCSFSKAQSKASPPSADFIRTSWQVSSLICSHWSHPQRQQQQLLFVSPSLCLSFNCKCISDLFHLTTLTMKDQWHDFDSDLGKKATDHMTLKSFLFYMTIAVFGNTRVRFLSSQHTKSEANCAVLITDVCVGCSYSSPVLKRPPKQSIIQIYCNFLKEKGNNRRSVW